MKPQEALALVKRYVSNRNLIKHMIAAQSCMRFLARHFGEDEEAWALAGLLHDIDYERTESNPSQHGLVSAEILKDYGLDQEILHAVVAHTGRIERTSRMAKALYCVDPLTGLVVASALMHPTGRVQSLDCEFVMRRFKEKRFAQGANREQIRECRELGLSLDEFIELCLEGMREVASELGL
ncbi:phosphohydrolase [candidate division TA06 bacterium DG_26]|uniref:Phosphohydrolase n=1 Tax=candidate division TA06 bacterium DG_26 TaxID=1703771 RepID=A0A0S7WJN1_UNCT6|nr:MAG: phosphohydrolase [candidate division TA06 bacterium DG_26]